MPTYEFQCKKCKAYSELRLGADETYEWVECPDCHSRQMELCNFDALDNKSLKNILDKISYLEHRLKNLEQAVCDEAEEMGLS